MKQINIYSKEQSKLVSKLIKARLDCNLTQLQVSKKLGRTQSYISKIESGQLRIDVVELKKFARIYNKDIMGFL
ncbi:MAG: helix-turn-helix domain-containing protein [Patescibacteria group bacterium]